MFGLLQRLETSKYYAQAYTNDRMVMIIGEFKSVVFECMHKVRKTIETW